MFGDYPEMMKKNVGSRLPSFTKVQSELIKGSFDFIGINHYYSLYVSDRQTEPGIRDYNRDMSIYYRGKQFIEASTYVILFLEHAWKRVNFTNIACVKIAPFLAYASGALDSCAMSSLAKRGIITSFMSFIP